MIYETRFHICHSYRCALLRRAERGELSGDAALDKISVARQLLARVVAAAPDARTAAGRKDVRSRLAEQIGGISEEERKRKSQQLLDIIALDQFLERWFRLEEEKKAEPTAR
jgi:hypothetical protein